MESQLLTDFLRVLHLLTLSTPKEPPICSYLLLVLVVIINLRIPATCDLSASRASSTLQAFCECSFHYLPRSQAILSPNHSLEHVEKNLQQCL